MAFMLLLAAWLALLSLPIGRLFNSFMLSTTKLSAIDRTFGWLASRWDLHRLRGRWINKPRSIVRSLQHAITAACLMFFGIALYMYPRLSHLSLPFVLLFSFGSSFFVYWGLTSAVHARAFLKPDAEWLLENDTRAPIVLLRSFSDDGVTVARKSNMHKAPETFIESTWLKFFFSDARRRWQSIRLEEAISHPIAQLGPFVTIGKPSEAIPLLGASRAYFTDEQWERAIIDWCGRARLVFIILGATQSVARELHYIFYNSLERKTIIINPPTSAAASGELAGRVEIVLKATLGTRVESLAKMLDWSNIRCITFDRHNRPIVVRSGGSRAVDYEIAIRVAYLAIDGRFNRGAFEALPESLDDDSNNTRA